MISRLYRRKAPIRSSEAEAERFFSNAKYVVESKSYSMAGQNLKVMVMQNLWEKQAKKAKSVQIVSNNFKKVATIEDEDI